MRLYIGIRNWPVRKMEKYKPDMSERTPLIQTVVVTRREPRYSHSTLRRFCTISLGSLLVLVVIGFLIPFTFLPSGRHHDPNFHWDQIASIWPNPHGITFEELQKILLDTPDEEGARASTAYYASGPHLAGTNLSQAVWTRERWEEAGIKSEIVAYDVYLNYPVDHRLALLKDGKVEYECNLEEDVLEDDPTTGLKDRIPTFHGYSASGNVTAPYVFVNYGTFQDYEDLINANVTLEGKIALAKYGSNFRGLKVKRAQELGMIGVVIYSDPGDDGGVTEENGYKAYPAGPARNPSSVQRGSTQFISSLPGDPTTPGYPSKPGVPRTNPDKSIPKIPSIPISYKDALPLLKALNGHGPNVESFGKDWQGGGLKYRGVDYNIGPSPDSVTLNLMNEQEYVTTPIWNVIGIINGTIPDEVVVLGNHRDAWIAGGAGDPNSGSAALNEVVRSFGQALAAGWKPLRTIVIGSWDGEEYALLGSVEWVEEYIPWLSANAVAYLNVDVGAAGSHLKVGAAPLLNKLIHEVTSIVPSPAGGSVKDRWGGQISTLGSGSDYTGFLDFAGIPSVDMAFFNGGEDAVYHYHSNYDSFHWMDTFGDASWEYHTTMAKIWALLAANVCESLVIPFNVTDYATSLKSYVDNFKKEAGKSSIRDDFNFESLDEAASKLYSVAVEFDTYATYLIAQLSEELPWWQYWKKLQILYDIRVVNTKYKTLERSFLHAEGLDDRDWFKHVVFAPGRVTGYAGVTFPGLIESFEDGNLTNAVRWSRIIVESLTTATDLLLK